MEATSTEVFYGEETAVHKCDYCGAEEGKERIIGNYNVSLFTVFVRGSVKRACQSCSRKHGDIRPLFIRKYLSTETQR